MKVRIGIGGGTEFSGPEALADLGRAITDVGFDSLWLPEILTGPAPDPLVSLAWVSGACPQLKLGTTMILPGRNLVSLAKAVGTLDLLSGGRFLLTFVSGLTMSAERSAVGVPTALRGAVMDDALPVLRRLWAGERVSHEGAAGSLADVSVSPLPVQEPFDVWLGGLHESALQRCGRLADGWIPALCTPEEAAEGKAVIDRVASEHGRAISPEHFGVSVVYGSENSDLSFLASSASGRRLRRRPLDQVVPVGNQQLRTHLERFLEVGFSKFIVRPIRLSAHWRDELEQLAGAVGDLQT